MIQITFLIIHAHLIQGHEKTHHAIHSTVTAEIKSDYTRINEAYISDVRPIFEKKCFNCHGLQNNSPWYRHFPIAKQIIDNDIQESKEHLDMTNDFPFKSHSTPFEDLKAIQKTITKNKMPPFRYRLAHSDSALTASEKEKVFAWTKFGQEILKVKSK